MSRFLHSFFCVFVVYAGSSAVAAPIYKFTDLGELPGDGDESHARAINSQGQVTGHSIATGGTRAFLWTPTTANGTTGTMIDLGSLGGSRSSAQGINDYGQVVGGSFDGSQNRAFLWQPTAPNSPVGTMVAIPNLPLQNGGNEALGINSSGQVTGQSSGSQVRGFLWTPNTPNSTVGTVVDIGNLPAESGRTIADSINDRGQITGSTFSSGLDRAFVWTPSTPNASSGTMANIGTLPGGEAGQSAGHAINDSGQIAGTSHSTTGRRAFVWTPNTPNGSVGTMINLGDLPGGTDLSFAYGLNSLGHVVGDSNAGGVGVGNRAFLWMPTEGMRDLNDLLDGPYPGWTLILAHGINDAGQIVGSALYDPDGPGGVNAVTHAYLLTPIPEPGVIMICGAGMFALGLRRRSRAAAPASRR